MPAKPSKNNHVQEVEDVEDLSADEYEYVEEDEVEEDTPDKKTHRLTCSELFTEIIQRFNTIETSDAQFSEDEKSFDKLQKEFLLLRKKTMRELSSFMKRFEKSFNTEIGKKKPRKTDNAGKGGFNKLVPVPPLLGNYIGIGEDELMTRPQVTKLLNKKFADDGLMETRTDDAGKETKYIVLNNKTAKALKRLQGTEVKNRDIQTFIAQFYKEIKDQTITA